ncbi:PREDICTED: protein kinase byr2 [Theobroma cacao]|uniref:Protein kinase byr2 n=1 Tax=Theobroma cacao TaxID=3641 RepID=A0AB32W549_THECC|nr:PREDICTED: protein kinase byr2 [Theobroma cacao]
MDFVEVKGVARNGLTMEWIKLKTIGKDSFSLRKEQHILKEFVGCRNIVPCFGDMLSTDQEGALRMLVEGIQDIHERDYVHCDLMPKNILVYSSDYHISISSKSQHGSLSNLKIANFGLAKQLGERDMPDQVEPWMPNFPSITLYMPSEYVKERKISASIDIWSLRCIILEMIIGKLPWGYQNLRDLKIKFRFSRDCPKIPDNMSNARKDLLMKCFARDPIERWIVDMLLCHLLLISNCTSSLPSQTNSFQHAQCDGYFPSIKQILATCLAIN